jgi:hypothetical protein
MANKLAEERVVITPQIIHPVDIEDIERRMFSDATSEEIVDEFYKFGQIMFAECLQRGSELDRKLANMLGWSTAALAFLLLNHSRVAQFGIVGVACTIVAVASALFAVATTSFALKTRMWAAPSEEDWFKDNLWGDPSWMKRHHVVSLLLTHQVQTKHVARKARHLRYAELSLPASALAIAVSLLVF